LYESELVSTRQFSVYFSNLLVWSTQSKLANDNDEKQKQEKYFKDNILFKEFGEGISAVGVGALG